MTAFLTDAVLKRDVFSETQKGHLAADPLTPVIRRIVTASPWWSRPLAWWLAKREIGALRALTGLKGTPRLIETDANGLLRTWTEGTPLHLARPSDPAWYRDAHRLLRSFRRRNLTHNDLAKPQNWLMSPDGRACVIDFQLASVHSKRGWLFKAMAYEDFRHLLKQRRSFAPQLMTPTAKRILKRRSLPSRIWMNTGKKLYNLVTRGIFNWSDGEGTGDRIDREGAAITSAFRARPTVRDVALVPFPLPSKGTGIYAFIEGDAPEAAPKGADLVQVVSKLPRRADGSVRSDLLQLVAMNQMTELDRAFEGDPDLAALMQPIVDGRLNFTDRRISSMEAKAG